MHAHLKLPAFPIFKIFLLPSESFFKFNSSNGHFGVNAHNSGRPNTMLGVGYTFKSSRKFLFLSNMKKKIIFQITHLIEMNVCCVTHIKIKYTLFTVDKWSTHAIYFFLNIILH